MEELDLLATRLEPDTFENIDFRTIDDLAYITLKRPTLNTAMLIELGSALEKIDLSETIKIVVIQGGDSFCSGLDMSEHTDEGVYQLIESFYQIFMRLTDLEPVVISVVTGMALGAGCELATFCDFCLAAEDAKLGQPELKVGLFPSVAAVTYPRLIGVHRAMELIMTGRTVSAREAQQMGLITRAIDPAQLSDEVEKWVQFLRSFSTPVLRMTRRLISGALHQPFDEAMRASVEIYLNQLVATDDAKEGVSALIEGRPPVWKHR